MAPEEDQDLPESIEKQLCISCMAPNDPSAHFCAKCGAPLSSYASTGPFESIFAEGAVCRQAAECPRKLFVVLGVWLIFGITALAGAAMIAVGTGQEDSFTFVLPGGAMLAFSVAMIWKSTGIIQPGKRLWKKAMTRSLSAVISTISLIIYAVLLLLSLNLTSLPGGFWPWFVGVSVFAAVPIVAGPNRFRLMGAVALVLSVVLIVNDISEGKHFRAPVHEKVGS